MVICWPGLEQHLLIALVGVPREAQEDQHDADVDDVAAVAPLVAADEPDERGEQIGAGVLPPDLRAAPELLPNRPDDKGAQREAGERRPLPEAERERPRTVTRPTPTGNRNESRRLVSVDFRQASNGPTPVSNSMTKPIGTIHLLKNGATTVRRLPVTASLSVGNIVAKRTNSAENSRIQLFTRNAASRETHESSSLRALRSGNR